MNNEGSVSMFLPETNTRAFCRDCDKAYPVIVNGFAVPPTDDLQECYTHSHNIIYQVSHEGEWKEMLIDHSILPSRKSNDGLADMVRGAISMTENGQHELAIEELGKVLKILERVIE